MTPPESGHRQHRVAAGDDDVMPALYVDGVASLYLRMVCAAARVPLCSEKVSIVVMLWCEKFGLAFAGSPNGSTVGMRHVV